jgi:hypothetical protein
MKTPEEIAFEWWADYSKDKDLNKWDTIDPTVSFLAGYQAAQEQLETEYSALVSKGKVAMQTLNDQLADVSKVIIPQENCEAALNAMQLAQDLSEQAIRWMKTLPPASERCNQCAREGYRAGYQAAAPQWISVKDRLPEIGERVLISYYDGVSIGSYHRNDDWHGIGIILRSVTHWMPLPKPPEE